jgi:hypothetical protein
MAAKDEAERAVAQAYQAYQDTLRAYQAMDFDDLIRLPVELFRSHPEALETWQGRLRYLLVDEYQDTNGAQYELMKLLAAWRDALPLSATTIRPSMPGAAPMWRICAGWRGLSRPEDHSADPELPLQPAHPARRQQRHSQQPASA